MPPKSTPAAKKPVGGAKATPKTSTTAAKAGTKPAPKAAAKKPAGAAAAKAAKPEEKKEAAPPAPKPIVFAEVGVKELDSKVVADKEGTIKASGKWASVWDENGISARFLRHRDVNMLTVPDENQMQPESIRKALLGSIKYGKPFVLDMMESEMYEFLKDQFDKVLPGLLDMLLDRSLVSETTYKYMEIVKEEDGSEFQNQYDYKMIDFSCLILSQIEPNKELLQKTFPVKIV